MSEWTDVPVDAQRRAAARESLERVVNEYPDVFGPSEESVDSEERPVLTAWVLVTHYADIASPTGWTTCEHSGTSWPMQIGLLTEVLNGWFRRDDDG